MTRPDLVLHGGFHKTATSHIQSILARNSKFLKREGVLYVHHRDARKRLTVPVQCNAYNAIGMDWDPKISDEELRRLTSGFFDELLDTGAERIILSDENMAGHCGHCVKRGMLYRWRRKLIEVFAAQFPYAVSEVHLGVRNYADFFASAYVEYLRSVQGQWFVDEPQMRKQVLEVMPSWHNILKSVVTFFPGAKIYVWKYEDFRRIDQKVLANLCGPKVDVAQLKEPKDKNKRPTASGRAVAELLHMIHKDGAKYALEQRVALQEKYPRGPEFGSYDPWLPNERAHLIRIYERDIEDIRANPDLHLLSVGDG
ncbi:hypothetical protein PEL8287_01217 [Roseovarius litorisediminis]|uniref:Sulfotransferase family protein n=1 Tax=Roseovarius litorisediminis TaxID=1312363 RepID=A0A1Y5RVK3_9RHOB|nr:hypothetical protein [Roseovarius litorisediminis]SLN26189.1 hypothetical protein PEL8287_01217 [Roseovarius litorisediminis]